MNVVFVQHGDFREATQRFAAGEGEVYFAQRHSVETVVGLTDGGANVSVVCLGADAYDDRLDCGVRSIGLPRETQGGKAVDGAKLVGIIESLAPDRLVPRTPNLPLLDFAAREGVRTLGLLADSFQARWRHFLYNRRVARALNAPVVEWACNHNVPAAESLLRIGVTPSKVVPWDWRPASRPEEVSARDLDLEKGQLRMIYVGAHRESKGLGDTIRAVALLKGESPEVHLTTVGGGDAAPFEALADSLGIRERVDFLGRLTHDEVGRQMRAHDVVVVPSRHSYPEGLPMTIYDALAARTPLLASDHPMFTSRLHDGQSALLFRAEDPEHLAARICELVRSPSLYRALSDASPESFREIECPAKWDQVLTRWLSDRPEDRQWLASQSLAGHA